MARRRKKRKFTLSKRKCLFITLIVVVFGMVLLILNRTRIKEPVYDIYFHENEAEIYIGDQVRFGYTISNSNGEDKVLWSTSNNKVAKVDNTGKVTGVSFGDVIITAELSNGKSSSMNLRVRSYPVHLIVNTDIKPIKGWYNKETNITFDVLNINDIKYCATTGDECHPITDYKNKITLGDGIWHLYISGIDRNGKVVNHHEMFKVDLIKPKCNITRIGKLNEESATIEIICEDDASDIEKYEWYRDETRIFITDQRLTYVKDIYALGKHKYSVKVYDNAENVTEYSIDN